MCQLVYGFLFPFFFLSFIPPPVQTPPARPPARHHHRHRFANKLVVVNGMEIYLDLTSERKFGSKWHCSPVCINRSPVPHSALSRLLALSFIKHINKICNFLLIELNTTCRQSAALKSVYSFTSFHTGLDRSVSVWGPFFSFFFSQPPAYRTTRLCCVLGRPSFWDSSTFVSCLLVSCGRISYRIVSYRIVSFDISVRSSIDAFRLTGADVPRPFSAQRLS